MTKPPRLWLNLLEWALLSLAIGAFTVTEQYHWYITAGLLLLSVAFVLRWARTGVLLPRTGLELPLLLFLVSAGVATWIAVDQATALLQFARMLGAAVLFYAGIQSDLRLRPWLAAGIVLLSLALAFYWPLQHDFAPDQGKFPLIAQVGSWITAHIPAPPGPYVHPNVASTTLAPPLAFALALAFWAGKRKPWLVGLSLIAALVIFAVLILTSSRGAWLALALAGFLAMLVLIQRLCFPARFSRRLFWAAILLVGVLILAFLILTGIWESLLGQFPDPSGSFQSRLSLWQQVLLLAGDAPFTGYGLMGFRPVFSTYGLLIHVPFHDHAHNTYLEVWLEQGLPGLIALLWGMFVVVLWGWRALERGKASPWGWAGLAALGILAVHSVFDAVYVVTRPLPLLGLFAGMAWMLTESASPQSPPSRSASHRLPRWLAPVAALLAAFILVAAFFRPLLASWSANLGVIAQTRLELTAYDSAHFDNPTLDEIRQGLDLSRAVANFERALRWDASNRTALQRLAQISLSRGEYPQALALIQAAWDAGHHDQITRLLLGDALAAQGAPQAAAELVRGLPWAAGRLNTQAWYRYFRQADYARAAFAWQAVLVLEPTNPNALNGLQAIPQP